MQGPFKEKAERYQVQLTKVEARALEEVLRGYLSGQLTRYRNQHNEDTYDLNNGQLVARIMGTYGLGKDKLIFALETYEQLLSISGFELEDELGLFDI